MGLIKAALGSAGGVLADQWKEYFYCDSMAANVLVTKGKKRPPPAAVTPRALTTSFPTALSSR